jgi:hypothetical protein
LLIELHVVDEFELAAPHARAPDEHRAVLAAKLIDVVEAVEGVEDHLQDRADLLAAVEREPVGERRAHDRVSGEGVERRGEIARFHRAAQRQLGGWVCERGHRASFEKICQSNMLA